MTSEVDNIKIEYILHVLVDDSRAEYDFASNIKHWIKFVILPSTESWLITSSKKKIRDPEI